MEQFVQFGVANISILSSQNNAAIKWVTLIIATVNGNVKSTVINLTAGIELFKTAKLEENC